MCRVGQDIHLCIDSRNEVDVGKQLVDLEPPAREEPAYDKACPPHMVSHWRTITSQHRDPPARTMEREIAAYRGFGMFSQEYRDAKDAQERRTLQEISTTGSQSPRQSVVRAGRPVWGGAPQQHLPPVPSPRQRLLDP